VVVMDRILTEKYEKLKVILEDMAQVVVAMSGGVDSVMLAKVAADILGDKALAVTADSPSLPRRDLRETVELAQQFGIRHEVIKTDEVKDPRYAANPVDRCYYCKDTLFDQLELISKHFQAKWVCFGENLDDLSDHRPGGRAALEHSVRAPLKEAGFTKEEIRQLAHYLGLPIWDKPASACLASRFPYGVQITPEKLAQVEQAEDFLFELGIRQSRVRHHGEIARIEVETNEMYKILEQATRIDARFKQLGYTYVTLDLAGYRRGRLNEATKLVQPLDIKISG
jgi:uncharacterized protein